MMPILVTSVVSIVSVPLYFRFLGEEKYALWIFIATLTGAFGFMDLGMGVATGRFMGVALGKSDQEAVQEYWATGNAIVFPMVLFFALSFIVAGTIWGPTWFRVAANDLSMMRWAIFWGGCGLFFSYYGQMWHMLAQTYLDFKFLSLLRTATSLVSTLGTVAVALWTKNVAVKITELKTMWERAAEGKITTWNQIRPEWPNTPLKLFGAGRDSGTFDYFQDAVTGKKGGIRSDYVSSENDDELIHGIEQTPGALGFIPYAYFFKEGKKLKALAVQCDYDAVRDSPVPGAPATLPSEEAVLSGAYTPFGRPMFIYVNAASLEAKPHLKDFLLFFLINADTFVDQVHYLSLPKISYARSIAALESKQIGTRFFGVPEIGLSVTDMIQRRPR
jgi:hypothetical protein